MESIFEIAKRKTQKMMQGKNTLEQESQRVVMNGIEKLERDNTLKINMMYLKEKQRRMYKSSLYNEQGVLDHHFKDFIADTDEQKTNLLKTRQLTKCVVEGEKLKAVFTGNAGTGKTMLSVCLMNYVYENTNLSCLFVSVPKLMDWERVRAGETDQQRAINVEKCIQHADLVVWDDLGSETSLMRPDKKIKLAQASEYTQRVLFTLADSRKGKVDIFTTNNNDEELLQIYNGKIISRLLTVDNNNVIKFSGTDHRMR